MNDKTIYTLRNDIYDLVRKKDGWFKERTATDLSTSISSRLLDQFNDSGTRNTLRLSQMGPRCPRALWYQIRHPEMAEALPPWATIKYSFGHVLEALAIALAKESGHTVTGEQDAVEVDGIVGHRDCVIDGCIVDVKSCSTRALQKLKDKSLALDDSFGYLDQLDGYLVGSAEDPLVTVKDKAYILGIDKTLGHIEIYEHRIREASIRGRIRDYKEIVARGMPPDCNCGTKAQGKSGNIQLDTRASYSLYKYSCFPKLRTFLYADGPVYLTHVERKPEVTEVDRHGKIVYH